MIGQKSKHYILICSESTALLHTSTGVKNNTKILLFIDINYSC